MRGPLMHVQGVHRPGVRNSAIHVATPGNEKARRSVVGLSLIEPRQRDPRAVQPLEGSVWAEPGKSSEGVRGAGAQSATAINRTFVTTHPTGRPYLAH